MATRGPLRDEDPLVDLCLADLRDALGLATSRGTWLDSVLRPLARRFAGTVRQFDDRVDTIGLAAASIWLMQGLAGGLRVDGSAHIPANGPLLVLANHPGMTDTTALFASLHMRADLRVIALDRPFLRAMPHVASRLIFASGQGPSRMRTVRAGIEHLRQGGALLTFPAGAIEPDPVAVGAGPAVDALAGWSSSFALWVRAVPGTRVVPAIVGQVVSAQALHHPLTRLRTGEDNRNKLAAALQLLWRPYQALPARVAFGAPIALHAHRSADMRQTILARASALIEAAATDTHEPPAGLRY
ncbi:hypothetical protein O4H66_13720 [Comamonadaceae bacterium G21597-S1]|nr:hypothetical protein [Comamonadaceae bacterium G21597-S1]